MSLFTILLGGDLFPTPAVLRQAKGTRTIAADAGMKHAEALGVVPELWVGDFDSEPEDLPERLQAVERQGFPREKDKTDGELAADIALERGATSLLLVGAFGGPRSDHEFLHLTLAIRLMEKGIPVALTSGRQEGFPLREKSRFSFPNNTLFSVIAFSELTGLTVTGAKWPLHDVTVPFGSSWTISNETDGPLEITLEDGRAMLIVHPAVTQTAQD
ncbi:thiamine diphosphokinase [Mesorhizobium sp. LHD-90]|uniref:thiamine diphosphokinase n=1 Tax=Mesorhizobium sp. LHD-90 TaxID=3071414 RepID=UPI0027DF2BC0|nr:thiamine diphosphokinase [Mesorhizobium sp. LHD-90]MDQ6437032.1 thiamine diphosphokinase [Mesorhizobium sp. LHD-90]